MGVCGGEGGGGRVGGVYMWNIIYVWNYTLCKLQQVSNRGLEK